MRLTFFGAARGVTGSCFLLEAGGKKLLIDCGLFQGTWFAGEENAHPFYFSAKEIDAVLITHAHADHVARIPKLHHAGFRGPMYATTPTRDLAELILYDSVKLMSYDAVEFNAPILYTEHDVRAVLRQFKDVRYRKPFELFPGVRVTFFDAGHILGSAFILIEAEGKRIVFSGDLGNPPTPILEDTDKLPATDYLVCETTYGGRIHEEKKVRVQLLRQTILDVIQNKGILMIPVFAMERTQEILYELNGMVEQREIPRVPIFLDSPLAIGMTEVYKKYPQYFDKEARALLKKGDDIFSFPSLTFTRDKESSKRINNVKPPKIILAGSGSGIGGRILHHEKRYLSDPKNCLLIVSWQIPGSLGRQLLEGAKEIKIHHEKIRVRAHIRKINGYSSHADQAQLLSFIENAKKDLKKVFLVHGEEDQQKIFARELQSRCVGSTIIIPKFKQSFEL